MPTGRPDLLETGDDRRRHRGLPRRAGRVLVALSLVAAVLVTTRADLLSAHPDSAVPAPHGHPAEDDVPRPVARDGHYFVTALPDGPDRWLARPTPLPPAAGLLAVPGERAAGQTQVLLAAQDGLLFRADMTTRRWLPLGRADRLVSTAHVPGRALVLRDGRLEEVEVTTGRTADPAPFPGYDGPRWRPRGVLDASGLGALVMTRDAADGSVEVALAWPGGVTRVGQRPEQETLGRFGAYLGVSGHWLLVLGRSCPGPRCDLQVLRMTARGLVTRTVATPAGWAFAEGPVAGRPPRMLVPVQSLSSGRVALAVTVHPPWPAVLVPGSRTVRQEAGLVAGPDGSVYMLRRGPGARDTVVVHDPASPPVLAPVSDLPAGTRLVCVCG